MLPRFFHSSFCSGVQSIHLVLGGVKETSPAMGEGLVDCAEASWVYTFKSGYIISLKGPLRAHVVVVPNPPNGSALRTHSLKFHYIEFSSNHYEKFLDVNVIIGRRTLGPPVALAAPEQGKSAQGQGQDLQPSPSTGRPEDHYIGIENAKLPPEPVNAFGIPQATMRCLEVTALPPYSRPLSVTDSLSSPDSWPRVSRR